MSTVYSSLPLETLLKIKNGDTSGLDLKSLPIEALMELRKRRKPVSQAPAQDLEAPKTTAERFPSANKAIQSMTGQDISDPVSAAFGRPTLIEAGQGFPAPSMSPDRYLGPFLREAAGGATLGVLPKLLGDERKPTDSQVAEIAGSLVGMLAPYGAAGKLVQVAESAPALAKVASGALTMGMPALGREAVNAVSGENVSGSAIANETAIGAMFGLAAPLMQKLAGVEPAPPIEMPAIVADTKKPVDMIDNAPPVTPAPVSDAAPVSPAKQPTVKEPWEMTREEFNAQHVPDMTYSIGTNHKGEVQVTRLVIGSSGEKSEVLYTATPEESARFLEAGRNRKGDGRVAFAEAQREMYKRAGIDGYTGDHRVFVEHALSKGIPVPPEALADYPGLKPPVSPQGAVSPAKQPTVKEPWEMTREEFESQPNVVYHGGSGEYQVTTGRGGRATGNPTGDFGAFFTPRLKEAERYVSDFHAKKGAVNAAILDLKNPYMMPFTEMDKIIGVDWKKLGLKEGEKELRARVSSIKNDLVAKGHDGIIVGTPGKPRAQEVIAFNDNQIIQHKYAVRKALSEGKPVPPEVLADYPDLKPAVSPAKQPTVKEPLTPEQAREGFLKQQRDYEDRLMSIHNNLSGEGGEFVNDRGVRLIVSKNIDPRNAQKYPYRVTSVLPDGTPRGHEIYKDLDEAVRGVAASGGKPIVSSGIKVGDKVAWDNPRSGVKSEYEFRGYDGDNAVLYNPKSGMQVSAPKSEISVKPSVSPQGAKPLTEYGAGFSPTQAKSAFEKLYKKSEGGDRFVNILGTPEVVLRGRGIVEPFQEGKALLEAHKHKIQAQLKDILGDVVNDPKARTELFNKLDDPEAALEGQAAGLRKYLDEIRTEVNKHRVARGQNEIPYRKGYITHLIEDPQQISTVFQDVKIPKFLKFAFEKRKGGGKYKTDVVQALEAYTDAALRDIYYGDALYKAVPKVEALNKLGDRPIITKKVITSPDGKTTELHFYNLGEAPFFSERRYAEEFLKNQLGWPTSSEKALAGLGIPVQTQKAVGQGITQLYYKSLLGAALDTGVKNLTQGINNLSEYGLTPSLRGISKLATKGGVSSARHEHLLEEFEPLLQSGEGGRFMGAKIGGKSGAALNKFDGIVLSGPMRFSEFVNRGITFHTALDEALQVGKSIEEANTIAHAAVRKLQFGYGKLDQSPYLRAAIAKPLAQFSSYPLKQAELLYRWAGEQGGKAKIIRYFATVGALVAGATYVGVDVSNTFPNPFRAVDPESKGAIKLPGSDKAVRFDPTKMLTSGFMPSGAPPVISTTKDIVTGMMSDDPYEVARAKRQAVTALIPGGRYGTKIYEAVSELRGKPLRDARDRIIRQPSPKEAILKLVGFSSTQSEVDRTQKADIKEIEDFYKVSRQKLVDAIIAGDEKTVNSTIAKIEKKYPELLGPMFENMSQSIQDEAKNKELTAQERFTDERLRAIIQDITRQK